VTERVFPEPGVHDLLKAIEDLEDNDVVNLRSPLTLPPRRVLFHAAHAVLANSGHEPFGLVGLETMAVRGVACTGCSGEDCAIPGYNALVLETNDPQEFTTLFSQLRANPGRERALRRAGSVTAKHYLWSEIIQRLLLPRLHFLANRALITAPESPRRAPRVRPRRRLSKDVGIAPQLVGRIVHRPDRRYASRKAPAPPYIALVKH
jgi:hypothetical protein